VKQFSYAEIFDLSTTYCNLKGEQEKQQFVCSSLAGTDHKHILVNGKQTCIDCYCKLYGISNIKQE
jgi:hypothetical protein